MQTTSYGWALSQPLPTGEFEQYSFPKNYPVVGYLLQVSDDNEYGYFVQCDLEYPVEIKEKTGTFLCVLIK